MILKTLIAGLMLSSTLAVIPSKARADEPLTRPAVEAIIKDYLMQHPEVITEALAAMQAKQEAAETERQSKALTENLDDIINAPQNAVLGNPKGDVTLVEFFDYNCGYCKRALPDLIRLLESDKNLKVILRDYPILSPGSVEAATIALGVKKQMNGDKFLKFHQELMATRGTVGKDRAFEVARSVGVDMNKLEADIKDPAIRTGLSQSLQVGETLGIGGTPSYIIGKEIVAGAIGYDALAKKIDSVRKCGKTSCD